MIQRPVRYLLSIFLFVFIIQHDARACSMYKVTATGKTMVGCNYDTWYTSPKIWFQNATSPDEYGLAISGARRIAHDRIAPNSGMNEAGLAFARLASYYPEQENPFTDRKRISDEFDYLSGILQQCASIEEVKAYIEQYDHSVFIEGVFIYIDTTGAYLVVEPYNLIEGNDPNYVLSNFCPSITDNKTARRLVRYRNGEDFIKNNEPQGTLEYCSVLSDTMSVNRRRNGDGTLLTSIYDVVDRKINLYFYHAYDHVVQYDLRDELKKGDHTISIPEQFPKNKKYERLVNYVTPFNTPTLKFVLLILGGVLTLFAFVLGLAALFRKQTHVSLKTVTLPSVINLLLTAYLGVLATNKYAYYFDAPFKHHGSDLISASSYIPFVLLVLIIPITIITLSLTKSSEVEAWLKAIFVSNNLIYIALILSFGYWGLYSVWH